jgi:hypothetical protein
VSLSLEEIVQRLGDVRRRLDALPPGPSPERLSLLSEQDDVRRQAAEFQRSALADRTDDDLRAELDSLKIRLDREVTTRTGFATGKGGGAAGGAVDGAWVQLGQDAKTGGGLDSLIARISVLEDEIARRRPPSVS